MGSDADSDPAAPLLRQALPLFPLHTVLFPDSILALQIFEVRYLDLIGRCYKNATPFGVVSLREGSEVRQVRSLGEGFASERFADVGTLATIVAFEAVQPGLMRIRCSGGPRFRIRSRSQLRHGLWVADTEDLAPDPAVDIPEDLMPLAHALGRLLENQRSDGMQDLLPVQPPFRFGDCGWVANRWADMLTLQSDQKQNLMQLDNPLLRLELVGDLLHQAQAPRP